MKRYSYKVIALANAIFYLLKTFWHLQKENKQKDQVLVPERSKQFLLSIVAIHANL